MRNKSQGERYHLDISQNINEMKLLRLMEKSLKGLKGHSEP